MDSESTSNNQVYYEKSENNDSSDKLINIQPVFNFKNYRLNLIVGLI